MAEEELCTEAELPSASQSWHKSHRNLRNKPGAPSHKKCPQGTIFFFFLVIFSIQVNDLSIEQSEVELKENDAIDIAIKNVTAVFKGTLTYGYAGAWL